MLQHAQQWLRQQKPGIEDRFGIRFWIFAAIYLASFAPFYLGIVMAARGAVLRSAALVAAGIVVNRLAWAAPYLYPLLFGTLPKRIKILLFAWTGIGVVFGAYLMRY